MFDLTGKVAVVTGATGGIGRRIAATLHAQGASVLCAGTRIQVLDEIVTELGDRAIAIAADLADPAAGELLVRRAEEEFGRLDLLISNAGLTRDGLALRMKDDDWSRVIDVNLTASFRLARAAFKGMMRRRHGRIVFITSVVGTMGNAGQANYVASKAGLTGLAKSLAQEVASRNITVNCVAPGFIDTPMTQGLTDQQRERMMSAIAAGRFGAPDDVAAAVAFLVSDEAAYVTGQTLHVNGGMLMP